MELTKTRSRLMTSEINWILGYARSVFKKIAKSSVQLAIRVLVWFLHVQTVRLVQQVGPHSRPKERWEFDQRSPVEGIQNNLRLF